MTDTTNPIVIAARSWLDTPYQHQARIKGVAVDCIGLVIGVARETGRIAADFDITAYPRTPDGRSLIALCEQHMAPVVREEMEPGHVVVVAFDKDPQHFGILGDYRHGGLSIIHAASSQGRVIETRLMFSNAMRFVAAYALPGGD